MVDILGIGAHPDDMELAAGGTLLKHRSMGYTTAICDLTRGELGTRGTAEIRAKEALASAKILGLKERIILDLGDGFFIADKPSLLQLIAVIRYFQPRIVIANAVSDRHPDHGSGATFISKACFLAGLPKVETSFRGKVQPSHRPAAVYHCIQDHFITPDLVVDITPFFPTKMKAIRAFGSQFFNPESDEPETPISSQNFIQYLESRAREMGRIIHTTFGEGFTVERAPGVNDLLHLL